MSTPIRESCLIPDPDNEDKFIINSTGRAVIDAINGILLSLLHLAEDSGCLNLRENASCHLPVHWFRMEEYGDPYIGCCLDHAEEAYHPAVYGQIVADTIHSHIPTEAEEEEEEAIENYAEVKREARRTKEIAESAVRLAKEEADTLGMEFKDGRAGVVRPMGKAPDGKTWSYLFGHWNDDNWLKKRKAVVSVEENDQFAGVQEDEDGRAKKKGNYEGDPENDT
jgi:hypothetical protein